MRKLLRSVSRPTLVPAEHGSSGLVQLPPVPSVLHEDVVCPVNVETGRALTIYVDARRTQTVAFLTWIGDVRRIVRHVSVETVSAGDLAQKRAEFASDDAIGNDQETLLKAMNLVAECARAGVSDIHLRICPDQHKAVVEVRRRGDLMPLDHYEMRPEEGEALSRAFYNGLATVREDGTFNPLSFQNAQIAGDALPGMNLSSVRIVRGPAYPSQAGGGFMIARLQSASPKDKEGESETGLERLAKKGFTPLQLGLFEQMVRLPMGIVTVTGPTGSGKTTTLFELMRYQHQLFPESRQLTVEDPPENPLPWGIQLEADSHEFAARVKTALRMDPDIILVGELRDSPSALAAVQAAQTGHFCWATLHVTDPYKVFARLETMDPKQLSFAHTCDHELFVGATSQRLVGKLCPHCAKPLSKAGDYVPRFMLNALKSWGDLSDVRVRGDGCKACEGLKIAGRAAVAELVMTDESFMEDVLRHGILVARKNHRQKKGADKSMLANALDLVLRGEVCPVDVHRGVHSLVTMGEER